MKRVRDMVNTEKVIKIVLYIAFVGIYFYYHIPMGYQCDDAVVAPTISEYSLWERFVYLFFYNGRILTDTLANFFYRMPMIIWKVIDSLAYALFAYLIAHIFTQKRAKDLCLVMVLMLLFPIDYMASAGYIATTTNYIYTTMAILIAIIPLKAIAEGKTVTNLQHAGAILAMVYAINHDQAAVVVLLGLLLWFCYELFAKSNKTLKQYLLIYFIIAVVIFLIMFFMPGHINRMDSVGIGEGYPPNYLEWSFWQKLYVGYTSTVANLIFYEVDLFFVLSVLCLILLFQKKRHLVTYLIGIIPSVVAVLVKIVGRSKFVIIYDYSYWLPDLHPISDKLSSWMPFVLSIVVLASIIYTVCVCVEDKEKKFLILLLFVVAAASREMMGFSATIYKSSFRTFTFSLYAILICCLLMIQQLEEKKHKYLWYWGVGTVLVTLALKIV